MPDFSVTPAPGLRAPLSGIYAIARADKIEHNLPASGRAASRYWREQERRDLRASVHAAQRARRGPLGAAQRPPLGNSANSSPQIASEPLEVVEQRRRARRAERHALRHLARDRSAEHRVTGCGRRSVMPAGTVGVRLSGGVAGYSGLMTCGSVWVCPVCAAKIAAKRADDLGDVLAWARSQRRELALITFTVRHHKGDRLADVWDAVADGWAEVTRGSAWRSETVPAHSKRVDEWTARGRAWDRGESVNPVNGKHMTRAPKGWASRNAPVRRIGESEAFGVDGWVRAVEVTVGENGWHVHVHAVLVRDPAVGGSVHALAASMWRRWERGIAKRGFTAMRDSGGLDVRVAHRAERRLAEYLVKAGADTPAAAHTVRWGLEKAGRDMALEVTQGAAKKGRHGGRTPFELLADTASGDADDLALWDEWVKGSQGRRQLGWSAGLRELVGLSEEELTDDELAAVEVGSEDLLILTAETWRAIRDEFSVTLLEVVERSGIAGARRLLKRSGLTYFDPSDCAVNA